MKFATTLYQFPLGLVVTALSIATLPTLSRLAIDQLESFKRTLAEGIRLVITLILPATAGLFALAIPIIALLFEHGQFTSQNTFTTAWVLRIYLFGLPFAAVDQMLVFASYARQDTWRPALVGVISIVVYLITAVLLLQPLSLLSLMVADAVKHVVHTAIMLWLLKRHLGGLGGHGINTILYKSAAASILTGLGAFFVAQWLQSQLSLTFFNEIIIVVGSSFAGLAIYAFMVLRLDIPEAKIVLKRLRR